MSFVELTSESVGHIIGEEVPDAYVLVAKNSVMGLDAFAIADLLGVDESEVRQIQEDEVYKSVRLIIAAKHSESKLETDATWDAIELKTLRLINKRLDITQSLSMEDALRVAAVANRAQRRQELNKNQPLDAGAAGQRVNLTLTRRIREKLTQEGSAERETTEQISIRDGTMGNPSFADVDKHLGVSTRTRIPSNLSFRTSPPVDSEPLDLGELSRLMEQGRKK
jgi:hypothetical protein